MNLAADFANPGGATETQSKDAQATYDFDVFFLGVDILGNTEPESETTTKECQQDGANRSEDDDGQTKRVGGAMRAPPALGTIDPVRVGQATMQTLS